MRMRWVAIAGVFLVAGAIAIRTGIAHGLAFAGVSLVVLAAWFGFIDG